MSCMYYNSNQNFNETLLFIHSIGESSSVWAGISPWLAPEHKIITVDLWGHGNSMTLNSDLSLKSLADDLYNVLINAGSPDCYVIGDKFGCIPAISLAYYYPESIKGILLVDGFHTFNDLHIEKINANVLLKKRQDMIIEFMDKLNTNENKKLLSEITDVSELTCKRYFNIISSESINLLYELTCPYAFLISDSNTGPLLNKKYGVSESAIFGNDNLVSNLFLIESSTNTINNIKKAITYLKQEYQNIIKNKVNVFFSKQANGYYKSTMHSSEGLGDVIKLLDVNNESSVIDLGCGAGHTSYALAPHAKQVIAYDLSKNMLDIVNNTKDKLKLRNIFTEQGDIDVLNFKNDTFDRAVSRIAAHHFPNLPGFLNELGRVLKKGGLFLLVDNTAPEDPDLFVFTEIAEKIKDSSHFRLYTESFWKESLYKANFTIDYIQRYKSVHNFEEWAEVASLDENTKDRLQKIFLESSKKIKDYFKIKIEKNKVLEFTIDRIIIRAWV